MQYRLDTQNIDLSETDKELMSKKIDRLEKYVETPYVMDVRFVRNTHHQSGDVFKCIINLEHKKDVMHAERDGENVQIALDEALEALQQELKKEKDKNVRRRRWVKRLLRRQ